MEKKNLTIEGQEMLELVEKFEGDIAPTPDKPEKMEHKSPKAEIQKKQEKKQAALISKELKRRESIIKKQIGNIQASFLQIGFQLTWIKGNSAYKSAGYKNIYEYAENEFNIGRTNCCNFICIIENFAQRDPDGRIIESIQECYKNFSASQLVAMIGMSEETRKTITADMSVRKINEIRKNEDIQEDANGNPDDTKEDNEEDSEKKSRKADTLAEFTDHNTWLSNIEKTESAIEKAFKAGRKIKIVAI